MASRKELLDSISPSMRLDKGFFLKVYGYDLTYPGFAENVLARMGILGCSKARDYYTCVVVEYEHNHEKELKKAADWYRERINKEYEYRRGKGVREWRANNKKELLRKKEQLLRLKLQT